MKEHTAKELEGHRIRIQCIRNVPVGRYIMVTDLETECLVENVGKIEFAPLVPNEPVTVRLTLLHIGKMEEQPDGSTQASVHEETLTVNNPEIDLTAFVTQA